MVRGLSIVMVLALVGCPPGEDAPLEGPSEPSPLLDVDETDRMALDGLSAEVYVVYTEGNVPHIYAENREDLAYAMGFVVARDRYAYMDLARRLALGTLSELLGDVGLEVDIESRQIGMTYIADRIEEDLLGDPEALAYSEAFAMGINAYVDASKAGDSPAPAEY